MSRKQVTRAAIAFGAALAIFPLTTAHAASSGSYSAGFFTNTASQEVIADANADLLDVSALETKSKPGQARAGATASGPANPCQWVRFKSTARPFVTDRSLDEIYASNAQNEALRVATKAVKAKPGDIIYFDHYRYECPPGIVDPLIGEIDTVPVRKEGEKTQDRVSAPLMLALKETKTLHLPKPTPSFNLIRRNSGGLATLVNGYTWFWADQTQWKPLTKKATAGSTWVQVTATPTGLDFTPGDGQQAVRCTGPGSPFIGDVSRGKPAPQGCSYRYHATSGDAPGQMFTTTTSIRWAITWEGSANTSGSLPDMLTSTSQKLAVIEAQTLVTQ